MAERAHPAAAGPEPHRRDDPLDPAGHRSGRPASGGGGDAEGPQTALAPVWARAVAFAAIIAGGLAGALVGGRFGDVACTGSCDVAIGASMLAASVIAALGVAAVAERPSRARPTW